MKLTILAAFAAFSLSAQTPQVAAKPEAPAAGLPTPAVAPPIQTGKLWRLVVVAQNAHKVADETDAAKAAKAADAEVQAEQQKLAAACGPNFVLGYDTDAKSSSYQDLICTKRPEPEKPAEAKK